MRADGDDRSITDLMCDLLIEAVTGLPMTRTEDPPPAIGPGRLGSDPPDPDPDTWNPTDPGMPDPYPDSWAPPQLIPSPPRWRIPAKVEVQVVISAATLLGLDDAPCLLRGYGAIPVEVARDIVDNATSTTLRGLFADPVVGDGVFGPVLRGRVTPVRPLPRSTLPTLRWPDPRHRPRQRGPRWWPHQRRQRARVGQEPARGQRPPRSDRQRRHWAATRRRPRHVAGKRAERHLDHADGAQLPDGTTTGPRRRQPTDDNSGAVAIARQARTA